MTDHSDNIESLYSEYLIHTYSPELTLVRGKGTKVWDDSGKVYLDFTSGIAVLNVGHCHPHVVASVQKQAETLFHTSNLFYNQNQAELAKRISSIFGEGKVFFGNSGAEANEGLIKLARLWGHEKGKYEIISMKNSFHGRTLVTAAATGQDKVKKGFDPIPTGFVHATFNDLASVRSLISDKTVGVMLESIQAEGGVIVGDTDFLQGLRALCDEQDILLLMDEVQCGMGRTGTWFGFEHAGVKPDAFSLAKALGSGCPIGAVVASDKVSDVFQPGTHASTFGGGHLACASALATLDVIENENLLENARNKGAQLKERLAAFIDRYEHVVEVRGQGLIVGLVLDQEAKPLAKLLQDMGLLAIPTAGNVLRMLPPLNVKDDELEEALDILDDCLAIMHGESDNETT